MTVSSSSNGSDAGILDVNKLRIVESSDKRAQAYLTSHLRLAASSSMPSTGTMSENEITLNHKITKLENDIVSVENDIKSVEYAIKCIQNRMVDKRFQVIDVHLLYLNKMSMADLKKELAGLRQKEASLRQEKSDLRKEIGALTERLSRSEQSPQKSVSFFPTNEIKPVRAFTTIMSGK